jgi:hypothetical protein
VFTQSCLQPRRLLSITSNIAANAISAAWINNQQHPAIAATFATRSSNSGNSSKQSIAALASSFAYFHGNNPS